MTKETWKWWIGSNNERYDRSFANKDEALECGTNEYPDGFYICEADAWEWPKFDAKDVIEQALDNAADDCEMFGENDARRKGERAIVEESDAELQFLLNTWCEKWAHTFEQPDMFRNVRNEDQIGPSLTPVSP